MDTAEVQRRFEQLDNDVRETLIIVHHIEDTQITHGQRLDHIDTVLDEHGDALQALDARFDAMDAKFDAVDAKFEAVDARFDAMDAKFDTVIGLIRGDRSAEDS